MTTAYNTFNVKDLKVGDRVGFHRFGGSGVGYMVEKGFGTVTKINRHGHITVESPAPPATLGENPLKTLTFDKRGHERGVSYGWLHLCSAEWLETYLAREDKKNRIHKAVAALADAVAERRHCGTYHAPSEATKNEWRALIDAIENSDE